MRSEKVLNSFIEFCKIHPHQRFWQALRNWSGYAFIYVSTRVLWGEDIADTFDWEEKDK